MKVMPKDMKLICIKCPVGCSLNVLVNEDGTNVVTGNKCNRGKLYAINEITNPKRIVTSTVIVLGGVNRTISIKTKDEVPKDKVFDVVNIIKKSKVKSPIKVGDVILKDIAGTGADLVATRGCESSSVIARSDSDAAGHM